MRDLWNAKEGYTHGLVSMQGSTILNKTVEVGKTIVGGVADILGNLSGEMKKP